MELSILTKNIVEIYKNPRPKHRHRNRFLQRKTIPIAADGITIAQTYITDMKTFKHNDFYWNQRRKSSSRLDHKSPFRGNSLQVWVQRKANLWRRYRDALLEFRLVLSVNNNNNTINPLKNKYLRGMRRFKTKVSVDKWINEGRSVTTIRSRSV